MSDNDNKTNETFAKNAPQMSQNFNAEQEFAEYIPKLSEKGLEKFKIVSELGEQRLEKEVNDQKRHNNYRVMREENQLLIKYINSPDPRPKNLDVSKDIEIIKDQAKRNVAHKEAKYLESTKYDVRQNLQSVITKDLQEQQKAHLSPSHSTPQIER